MAAAKHAKPIKKKAKLTRSTTFAKNCGKGFVGVPTFAGNTKQGLNEIHHVLCVKCFPESMVSLSGSLRRYVKVCLDMTGYDINHAPNLIGLPLRKQYKKSQGAVPVNLPSHSNDHNSSGGYRDDVSAYLLDSIWDKLSKNEDKHKADAKTIAAQLKEAEKHFIRILRARGRRSKGTVMCWNHRTELAYEDTWYKPFSMADPAHKRFPGTPSNKLKDIFKRL